MPRARERRLPYETIQQQIYLPLLGCFSGGGSCGVGVYRTADGFKYQISTAHGRLADENWQNIDGGITPHVAIPFGPDNSISNGVQTFSLPSYAAFYDLDNLSQIVSEYYKK